MRIAIRVHTPELSEAVQRIAEGFGWKWKQGDFPRHTDVEYLTFGNSWSISSKIMMCDSAPDSRIKCNYDHVLDAKTDMPQIVEFFKTGKITEKEKDMVKTTIKTSDGKTFDVSRKGDDIKIGCETFPASELDKARKVKAEKRVEVKCEINNTIFRYDSLAKDNPKNNVLSDDCPVHIDGKGYSEKRLDEIHEWIHEIDAAKAEADGS